MPCLRFALLREIDSLDSLTFYLWSLYLWVNCWSLSLWPPNSFNTLLLLLVLSKSLWQFFYWKKEKVKRISIKFYSACFARSMIYFAVFLFGSSRTPGNPEQVFFFTGIWSFTFVSTICFMNFFTCVIYHPNVTKAVVAKWRRQVVDKIESYSIYNFYIFYEYEDCNNSATLSFVISWMTIRDTFLRFLCVKLCGLEHD